MPGMITHIQQNTTQDQLCHIGYDICRLKLKRRVVSEDNYFINWEVLFYFTEMNSRYLIFRANGKNNNSRVHLGEIITLY